MLMMASGRSVLPERMGGGPLGLGDPDDKTLRKVEKEVMIPQKMKEKAKKEKCPSEVKVFGECVKNSGFLLPFQCQPQARELRNCLSKWLREIRTNVVVLSPPV